MIKMFLIRMPFEYGENNAILMFNLFISREYFCELQGITKIDWSYPYVDGNNWIKRIHFSFAPAIYFISVLDAIQFTEHVHIIIIINVIFVPNSNAGKNAILYVQYNMCTRSMDEHVLQPILRVFYVCAC